MGIKLVEDVGAPLAVVAVDIASARFQPKYNEWLAYISTGVGYAGAWMGWGGDFVKNVGIASLPWAVKEIYNRFATTKVTLPWSPRGGGYRTPVEFVGDKQF